ncbi:hypothetical protein NLI96_g2108 [Meripilus lineatus]|uniref:F-box domain-containing protein n=1 Tax=Meripilus lineatus TaxID=2056292 RepID=A0AAD5VBL9_9APHY|nr:hypothetical protein NLI96_g2108 [Physisporinus lineatus]
MDSDDERLVRSVDHLYREMAKGVKNWRLSGFAYHIQRKSVAKKLFHKEEWTHLIYLAEKCKQLERDEIDWRRDGSAFYRFERFFDTIIGFHRGQLDLSGRHEARYRRLTSRLNQLLDDLKPLVVAPPVRRVPLDLDDSDIDDDCVDHPDLFEEFRKKWRAGNLSFQYILSRTNGLLRQLALSPPPIYQKLLLQDLPPELIHHIMQLADTGDARALGSVSRYFRGLAMSRIYPIWSLDLQKYEPRSLLFLDSPDTDLPDEEIEDELPSKDCRDELVDKLDYLMARPEILRNIASLTMFGIRYGTAKRAFNSRVGSPESQDYFGPIESRAGLLLQRIHNVERLELGDLDISPSIYRCLGTFNRLTSISIAFCQLADGEEYIQCPSILSAVFGLTTGDLALWSLLATWPNLRVLGVVSMNTSYPMGLSANNRTTYNHFPTLERLVLQNVLPEDVHFFTSWIRDTPGLKLTHFWLDTWAVGIPPSLTQDILSALTLTPLQVLVLQGMLHAEPRLLDDIARALPKLRGLTLFYRASPGVKRSKDTIAPWPYKSWEYASHFRGFRQLEFFGWNFYLDPKEKAFHRTLQLFETEFSQSWEEMEREESLADWNSIAKAVAAYCPTLKCQSTVSISIPDVVQSPRGPLTPSRPQDRTATHLALDSFVFLERWASMDSEDEISLRKIDESYRHIAEREKNWKPSNLVLNVMGRRVATRLFHKEELTQLILLVEKSKKLGRNKIDWRRDGSAFYRFERFFNSIIGFHRGELDLSGRHKDRYQRLTSRLNQLLDDLKPLVAQQPARKVPWDLDDSDIDDDCVDHPDLFDKFRVKWKAGNLSLEYILSRTNGPLHRIASSPPPIYQKLLLQDLPPELIHHIMQLADVREARLLGSVSKYFRFWSFDLKKYEPRSLLSMDSSDEIPTKDCRDELVDKLDYIIARPDILNNIAGLSMFGVRYEIAQHAFHARAAGRQQYLDFFSPIESRAGLLLQRIHKVERLRLCHIYISPSIYRGLRTCNRLTSISVFSCQPELPDNEEYIQCPSVLNARIGLEDLPLWPLLATWPNLRFLNITSLDTLGPMGLGANNRTTYNPFPTLERLSLEHVEPGSVRFFTAWMRDTPSLKLTHFWLNAGISGILPWLTEDILSTLSFAPLQVLVLEGILHAEPRLLDDIARALPKLRALTLLYRTAPRIKPSRNTITRWPYKSWEYASHFQGFRQLEFFGWNFHLDPNERAFHRTLQLFETGFSQSWKEMENEKSLADWNSIAKALAAYCPTLKYVVFHKDAECGIGRKRNGGIFITRPILASALYQNLKAEYFPSGSRGWEIRK